MGVGVGGGMGVEVGGMRVGVGGAGKGVGVARTYRVGRVPTGVRVGGEVVSSPGDVVSATPPSLPDAPQAAVTINKVKTAATPSSFCIVCFLFSSRVFSKSPSHAFPRGA